MGVLELNRTFTQLMEDFYAGEGDYPVAMLFIYLQGSDGEWYPDPAPERVQEINQWLHETSRKTSTGLTMQGELLAIVDTNHNPAELACFRRDSETSHWLRMDPDPCDSIPAVDGQRVRGVCVL
jgi:hypothetical protein